MALDLLKAFATTQELPVLNGTIRELQTNEQPDQPLIQTQPVPMPQANQSQPQWLWHIGGGNSYTVAYPSNWKVEETERVTPFDGVESVFTTDYRNTISIELVPSGMTSYEHFIRSISNYPDHVSKRIPRATIEGSGFGYYSLGGLQTFAILLSNPYSPGMENKILQLLTYINGWDLMFTYRALDFTHEKDFTFKEEMPLVQQMIQSLYFNR